MGNCHQDWLLQVVFFRAARFFPFLFSSIVDTDLEITLLSSNFSVVGPLPGDTVVSLKYTDDIVLFSEGANKMQSSDHLKQQCKHTQEAALFLQM